MKTRWSQFCGRHSTATAQIWAHAAEVEQSTKRIDKSGAENKHTQNGVNA